MPFKPFNEADNETGKLFQRESGHVYQVVGYITNPAVLLESLTTGSQHVVVINAPIAQEYHRLEPVSGPATIMVATAAQRVFHDSDNSKAAKIARGESLTSRSTAGSKA